MDLKTIAVIVLRRWYAVLPIAIAALIFAASSGGQPSHNVDASFLLVSPVAGSSDGVTNPLLQTQAGVNSVANVAAVVMHSPPKRAAVAEAGFSPEYLFTVANLEPFVTFRVVSDDPDVVVDSATVLARLFVEELGIQQLRFGASPNALVDAQLLEVSPPIADYSAVRTQQAIVGLAGLLVAFLVAFLIEGIAYLRSPKRAEFLELLKGEMDVIRYGAEADEDAAPDVALTEVQRAVDRAPLEAVDTEPEEPRQRWSRRKGIVGESHGTDRKGG